jgi:hypothetical protein
MEIGKILFYIISGILVLTGLILAFIGEDLIRNIGLFLSTFCLAIILHEATKQQDKI